MNEYDVPRTLTETIYLKLKSAISEGELKPGQRLHEKDIAAKFKVSVTPVREAFLRLSAEKFLINIARHEVLVNTHTNEEAMELYEIIRILDLYVVQKSIETITQVQIDSLKKLTQELGVHFKTRNLQEYLKLNLKIHDAIWRTCKNKALYETLNQTMEKIAVFRRYNNFMLFPNHDSLIKSYKDHIKLIQLIEQKNLKELEKLIRAHWGEEFDRNP
jgi:DNA-binding GntR family transcriptional regulator